MIAATQKILAILASPKHPNDRLLHALVQVIVKKGSAADAEALLHCFLEKPTDFYRRDLLAVVCRWGNQESAAAIYAQCFDNERLLRDIDESVLSTLGYLGYTPSRPALLHYAFDSERYYHSQQAVLGLLHLDCSDCESLIRNEIAKCYGQNLFAEFVPALAYQLADKQEVLANLYQLGCSTASVDCNGGLLLAFALCGEEGRPYFEQALWDPYWECCGGGTGSDYWAYIGMQQLGLRFEDLYTQIRNCNDAKALAYRIKVFAALLRHKIQGTSFFPFAFSQPPVETYESLHQLLFAWENPNLANDIFMWVDDQNLVDKFYQLRSLLELRMEMEWMEKAEGSFSQSPH